MKEDWSLLRYAPAPATTFNKVWLELRTRINRQRVDNAFDKWPIRHPLPFSNDAIYLWRCLRVYPSAVRVSKSVYNFIKASSHEPLLILKVQFRGKWLRRSITARRLSPSSYLLYTTLRADSVVRKRRLRGPKLPCEFTRSSHEHRAMQRRRFLDFCAHWQAEGLRHFIRFFLVKWSTSRLVYDKTEELVLDFFFTYLVNKFNNLLALGILKPLL